jgi:hypothetical protein
MLILTPIGAGQGAIIAFEASSFVVTRRATLSKRRLPDQPRDSGAA